MLRMRVGRDLVSERGNVIIKQVLGNFKVSKVANTCRGSKASRHFKNYDLYLLVSSAGNQATSSSPARFRPLHLLRRDSGELISRFSSHSPLLLLRRPFHSPKENSTKPDTSSDDTSDLHRGWNGLRRIGIGNPEETQGDGRARVGKWR
ncbi:hypothetical protein LXL04_032977 [Taraxacum kok-saghyz]